MLSSCGLGTQIQKSMTLQVAEVYQILCQKTLVSLQFAKVRESLKDWDSDKPFSDVRKTAMNMVKQISSGTEDLASKIPENTVRVLMDDDLCGESGEEMEEETSESVRLQCKEAMQSAEQFLLDADATSEITYDREKWLPCFQGRIELGWAWLAIIAENSVLGTDVGSEGHAKEQQAAQDLDASQKKCKQLCRKFVVQDYAVAAIKETEAKEASLKAESKRCETSGGSKHGEAKEGKTDSKSKKKGMKLVRRNQRSV